MTALWIGLLVAVVFGVVKGVGWWLERNKPASLGFVSSQWIAEQRVAQAQHRQR